MFGSELNDINSKIVQCVYVQLAEDINCSSMQGKGIVVIHRVSNLSCKYCEVLTACQ